MWVLLTGQEKRRILRRNRLNNAVFYVFIWLVLSTLGAALPGYSLRGNSGPDSWEDFLKNRLPGSLVTGLIIGGMLLFLARIRKSRRCTKNALKVCLTCGTMCDNREGLVCRCGGKIVDIEDAKWIDDGA